MRRSRTPPAPKAARCQLHWARTRVSGIDHNTPGGHRSNGEHVKLRGGLRKLVARSAAGGIPAPQPPQHATVPAALTTQQASRHGASGAVDWVLGDSALGGEARLRAMDKLLVDVRRVVRGDWKEDRWRVEKLVGNGRALASDVGDCVVRAPQSLIETTQCGFKDRTLAAADSIAGKGGHGDNCAVVQSSDSRLG